MCLGVYSTALTLSPTHTKTHTDTLHKHSHSLSSVSFPIDLSPLFFPQRHTHTHTYTHTFSRLSSPLLLLSLLLRHSAQRPSTLAPTVFLPLLRACTSGMPRSLRFLHFNDVYHVGEREVCTLRKQLAAEREGEGRKAQRPITTMTLLLLPFPSFPYTRTHTHTYSHILTHMLTHMHTHALHDRKSRWAAPLASSRPSTTPAPPRRSLSSQVSFLRARPRRPCRWRIRMTLGKAPPSIAPHVKVRPRG